MKDLLWKYIKHVEEREGSDFLTVRQSEFLTDAEMQELADLSDGPQPTVSNAGEREDIKRIQRLDLRVFAQLVIQQLPANSHLVTLARAALASKPPQGEQKPVGFVVHDKTRDMTTERAFHGMRIGSAFEVEPHDPECVTPVFAGPHPEPAAPPAREAMQHALAALEYAQKHLGIWSNDNVRSTVELLRTALSATPPAREAS